jgi:toxin ParE1/3/4
VEVILSSRACRDIEDILSWTEANFGPQTMRRYGKLIAAAIQELAENPETAGSATRPEIDASCRTYHLTHSRTAVPRRDRIRRPRHFVLYRINDAGIVEIGRLLHDSMDLDLHVPDEFRPSPE